MNYEHFWLLTQLDTVVVEFESLSRLDLNKDFGGVSSAANSKKPRLRSWNSMHGEL